MKSHATMSARTSNSRRRKAKYIGERSRHTLTTNNLPILGSILNLAFGGHTPFQAEVYFVNLKTFTDMKWGTPEPILFRDSEFKMIRLRSNGIYTIQITDPKLFVVKIVGTRGIFNNTQIEDFLRGVIVGRLADILGEHLESVLDLPRYFWRYARGTVAPGPEGS